jgi:2-polyprenyl-3-methyl-5-hydroxy-6-metoxy-1,4-benzoquinol methylase
MFGGTNAKNIPVGSNLASEENVLISPKYYSHRLGRHIDMENDGCPLDTWTTQYSTASFALHPKGFPVFLPPDDIEMCDEYSEADPYAVDLTASEFHQRRAACTLELIRTASDSFHQNPRILDLGCGRGRITAQILKEFPHAEVSALDYSISAIEYATDHFSGIDFAVGNAYAPPYSARYFDIVVCNNLWEHVPDPLRMLHEVHQILRDLGHLILSTPSRYRLPNLVRVLRGKPVVLASDHHVTEYTVGQVIEQLRYGGFDVSRAYSKPMSRLGFKATASRALISRYLSLMNSHHNLEDTVFYLAQKRL